MTTPVPAATATPAAGHPGPGGLVSRRRPPRSRRPPPSSPSPLRIQCRTTSSSRGRMGKNPHYRSSLHWLLLLWRQIWPPAGSLPPGDHPPPPPPGRDLLQVEGCRTVPPLGYISRHRQVMVTPHGRPWRGGRGSRSCPLMPSPLTPVASWRRLDTPPRGS